MELDEYIVGLLDQAAQVARGRLASQTVEEFEQSLDRIAEFSNKIPVLPDEAFSRASLYEDHD